MIQGFNIKTIDEFCPKNEIVLIRTDFDVPVDSKGNVIDDYRIKLSIPTITRLLSNKNKVIIITHRGRPKGYDESLSLKPIIPLLSSLIKDFKTNLIPHIKYKDIKKEVCKLKEKSLIVVENIRFYKEEELCDEKFSYMLSKLGTCYINEAFANTHRPHASIVGIPKYLPHYAGLRLKDEVETILGAFQNSKHPLTVIVGGAKISTKIDLILKIIHLADNIILGGGLANTFIAAQGFPVGKSLLEKKYISHAKAIIEEAKKTKCLIHIPSTVKVSLNENALTYTEKNVCDIRQNDCILDIGSKTIKEYESVISISNTIVWNGPMGYTENKIFRKGTDAILNAITANKKAYTLVGGGDTISAIRNKKEFKYISFVSSGGGAMLELIEKQTLPGLIALEE